MGVDVGVGTGRGFGGSIVSEVPAVAISMDPDLDPEVGVDKVRFASVSGSALTSSGGG